MKWKILLALGKKINRDFVSSEERTRKEIKVSIGSRSTKQPDAFLILVRAQVYFLKLIIRVKRRMEYIVWK